MSTIQQSNWTFPPNPKLILCPIHPSFYPIIKTTHFYSHLMNLWNLDPWLTKLAKKNTWFMISSMRNAPVMATNTSFGGSAMAKKRTGGSHDDNSKIPRFSISGWLEGCWVWLLISVRGYSLYPTLGTLSLYLLHTYSTCCVYATYPILHSSSPHCPSS